MKAMSSDCTKEEALIEELVGAIFGQTHELPRMTTASWIEKNAPNVWAWRKEKEAQRAEARNKFKQSGLAKLTPEEKAALNLA